MIRKSFVVIAVILIPVVINVLYMLGPSEPNTIFEASDLLTYVGVCNLVG